MSKIVFVRNSTCSVQALNISNLGVCMISNKKFLMKDIDLIFDLDVVVIYKNMSKKF